MKLEKEVLKLSDAYPFPGHLSDCIKVGPFLYTSGLVAVYPNGCIVKGFDDLSETDAAKIKTGLAQDLRNGPLAAQTYFIYKNLETILLEAKSGMHKVIYERIYMIDLQQIGVVLNIRNDYYQNNNYPALCTFQVSGLVPVDALIEIELIALS